MTRAGLGRPLYAGSPYSQSCHCGRSADQHRGKGDGTLLLRSAAGDGARSRSPEAIPVSTDDAAVKIAVLLGEFGFERQMDFAFPRRKPDQFRPEQCHDLLPIEAGLNARCICGISGFEAGHVTSVVHGL